MEKDDIKVTVTDIPEDAEPWNGDLHLDPLMVSRILESWDIFEDLDNELPKKTEK